MNKFSYLAITIICTYVFTYEILHAQERILIPLDSVVSVPDTAYAHYWVDTLGSGFRINTNRPDYPLIKERLYTTLPHHLRIVEDIIDLSATVSVGDTMRKTMFKPAYQSWYDSLQTMAQEFGGATYVLKNFTNYDSSWNVSGWTIFFTDTILSVAVEERIRSMNLYTIHSSPTIFLIEPDPFRKICLLPNESSLMPGKKYSEIVPNGSDGFWTKHWHKRGFSWNLYSTNAPLGWEVTQGQANIVVSACDQWSCTGLSNHPDIDIKETNQFTDVGNWLHIWRNGTWGDGLPFRSYLPNLHGMTVLPMVCGVVNNDNGNGGTFAGIAPLTRGLSYPKPGLGEAFGQCQLDDYSDVGDLLKCDVDLVRDNTLTRVAIVNCSHTGSEDYLPLMNVGIICVAAAANNIAPGCLNGSYTGFGFGGVNSTATKDTWFPLRGTPSTTAYTDAITNPTNDPQLDVKPLCVGAVQDGDVFNVNCDMWTTGVNPASQPNHRGNERFMFGWNYSTGVNKFSNNPDRTQRAVEKASAFIDVVAPGTGLLVPMFDAPFYSPGVGGTSQSSPQVAGVCALMTSINRWLDQSLGNINVQRRAYDIITFTATKLIDNGTVPPPFMCGTKTVEHIPVTQPQYVLQTNDNLKRSWAQRMGFGKVNAYRAVAHAIPLKGDYEYTLANNITLPFTSSVANERGEMLMHWGSQINELNDLPSGEDRNGGGQTNVLLNVLQWGGASLPGEFHNNQGVTRLISQGSGHRNLFIPSQSVLAIDGKLLGEPSATNGLANIVVNATNSTSKVLMEGYLQNVVLLGNIRTGDLIVDGTGFASSVLCRGNSEMYNTMRLINDGWFITELGGVSKLMTGSSVRMEGTRDIIVKTGGVLQMESASEVVSVALPNRTHTRIKVENGSSLVVTNGAKVDIDCEVLVESGATFRIEEDADVRIRKLTTFPGSVVDIKPGVWVEFFDANSTQSVKGKLKSVGTLSKPITISAKRKGQAEGCCAENCPDVISQNVMNIDGTTSIPSDNIELAFSAFHNVRVNITKAKLQPIESCYFASNTMNQKFYHHDVLVDITEVNNANFLNCRFTDSLKREFTIGSGFTGLSITKSGSLFVSNCRFFNLGTGLNQFHNGQSLITGSRFYNLLYGAVESLTNSRFCDNHFAPIVSPGYTAEYGLFGVMSGTSNGIEFFDNRFQKIQFCTDLFTSSVYRSNLFEDYMSGVINRNATAILNPSIGSEIINGRNKFSVPFANVYGNQRTDILTEGGAVEILCGNNQMAEYSDYHLGGYQLPTISTNRNEWLPSGLSVRHSIGITIIPPTTAESNYPEEKICGPLQKPGYNCLIGGLREPNDNSTDESSESTSHKKTSLSTLSNTTTSQKSISTTVSDSMANVLAWVNEPMFERYNATTLQVKDQLMREYYKRHLVVRNRSDYASSYGVKATPLDIQSEPIVQEQTFLAQSIPNPTQETTTIPFYLSEASEVTMKLYDVMGSHVVELCNDRFSAGNHSIKLNCSTLPSGVYIYRMEANNRVYTQLLTVVK